LRFLAQDLDKRTYKQIDKVDEKWNNIAWGNTVISYTQVEDQ
jgi:hypothetical protein